LKKIKKLKKTLDKIKKILYSSNMSLEHCICCGRLVGDKFRGVPMCEKVGLRYIGDFTSTKDEILKKEKDKKQ